MERNEARNDGNDQCHQEKPPQDVLQGQQRALLLQHVVERVGGQLCGFVHAVSLGQTTAQAGLPVCSSQRVSGGKGFG